MPEVVEILIGGESSEAVHALTDTEQALTKVGSASELGNRKFGATAMRLDALRKASDTASGSAAELTASFQQQVKAAERVGGGLAGVNQRLVNLKAAKAHVAPLYGELNTLATSALKAGTAILGIGAGLAVAAGKSSLGKAIERLAVEAGLKAIMVDSAKAEKHLVDLKAAASLPGVNLAGAIKMSLDLQGAQVSAERATEAIKATGNAIALVGAGEQEFGQAQNALLKIASASKLTTEHMNLLRESGAPVGMILNKAFGTVDTEAIVKLGLTGKQGFDAIVDSMLALPQAAGGVKNAVENVGIAVAEVQIKFGKGLLGLNAEDDLGKLAARIGDLEQGAYKLGKQLAPLIDKAIEFATALLEDDAALLKSYGTTALWTGGLLTLGGGIAKVTLFVYEMKAALAMLKVAEAAAEAVGLTTATGGLGAALSAPALLNAPQVLAAILTAIGGFKLGQWISEKWIARKGMYSDREMRGFDKLGEADPEAARLIEQMRAADKGGAVAAAIEPEAMSRTKAPSAGPFTPARDEEAELKARQAALKAGLATERERLQLAESRLSLAQAEGATWRQQQPLCSEIASAQERVFDARLKAAQADDDATAVERTKLGIEADRARFALQRIKAQEAADRAAGDARLKELGAAQAVADVRLKAAAGEVKHAEAMGASSAQIASLRRAERSTLESIWRVQLATAREQVKAGRDAYALTKARLDIDLQRRQLAMEEAERRRSERLESMGADQRLLAAKIGMAGQQAELAALSGNTAGAAAWKGQQARLQSQADELAMKAAGYSDPSGRGRAVELARAEIIGRKLGEAIDAAEERRRAAEDAKTGSDKRRRVAEQARLKLGIDGPGISDRLQSAVIGGDVGRVSDLLQMARRAGGGGSRRGDPTLDAIRNPNTTGWRRDIADALAERDRRTRQAVLDGVRGRR